MNQNKIQINLKASLTYKPLFLEILWAAPPFFMVMCWLLKVLRVFSQKNCSRVLYARSPLLSSKVPRENSLRLFPSKKKFSYAWILSFIYKAAHSLWNILFPFLPTCEWIWEVYYDWLTWRFPQGCSRILFGKWSGPL